MKRKITLLVVIILSQFSFSQMAMDNSVSPLFDYNAVDVQPQFIGGFNQFLTYVQKNFKPDVEGLSGTIKVDFIIDVNGFISNVFIKNDVGGMGQKLSKVLERSPKWDAGEEEEKKVRVIYHGFSINIGT